MPAWRNLRLQTKINLTLLLVLLVFLGLGSFWQHRQQKAFVMTEAIDKARIIAAEATRIREYLSEQLETGQVELSAARYGLIPVVTANRVSQLVAADLGYTIRHTSNRYRNPDNAPDDYERAMLQTLESDPQQLELYGTVTEGGVPRFRYLRAVRADHSCLPCHSEPDLAPPFIREIYPPEQDQAYHYRVGEVIGAVSITIPVLQLERQLQARLRNSLFTTAGIFLALAICLGLLTRQTVMHPLRQLASTIGRISKTGETGERLPVRSQDEIGQLMIGFNEMLDRLSEKGTALEESERRFRLLTELARDAIVAFLPNGQIFMFNRQAERIFGYSQNEMLGEPFDRLTIPDSTDFTADLVGFLARVDDQWFSDLHVLTGRRRDGSEVPLEISLARIDTGERPFYTAIMREGAAEHPDG